MNLKEAQEIINSTNFLTIQGSFPEEYRDEKDNRISAFSYLEGHSDGRNEVIEQMKPVVEALKDSRSIVSEFGGQMKNQQITVFSLKEENLLLYGCGETLLDLRNKIDKTLQAYRQQVLGEKDDR